MDRCETAKPGIWHYVRKYLHFAVLAAACMVGEVLMDLIQPGIMSRIVDDGVLGLNNSGIGDLYLILVLGLEMIVLVIFGGFCGSMNNVFVHTTPSWPTTTRMPRWNPSTRPLTIWPRRASARMWPAASWAPL